METLNKTGTILIDHVHLLSRELQYQISDYIENQNYRPFKSERAYESNVLLICTTKQPLSKLFDEGLLERCLYSQLRKNTICIPTPKLIAQQELYAIIDDIAAQVIGTDALFNVLQLSDKEKERISKHLPENISDFKKNIEKIITKKLEKTIHEEKSHTNHPLIDHAATLGKLALKDKKLMHDLFALIQNKKKIAQILGVNRSSIYRHYKE